LRPAEDPSLGLDGHGSSFSAIVSRSGFPFAGPNIAAPALSSRRLDTAPSVCLPVHVKVPYLRVRYHQERFRSPQDAFQGLAEILRIQRGKALIQNYQVAALQQGPCQEQAAAFPLRELPTGFAHHLHQTAGHALQQRPQSQFLDSRGEGKAVGQYRKLLSRSGAAAVTPAVAHCELVQIAGPDVHTIETFENVVGPGGPMPPETAAQLPFARIRNFTPLEFDFDGVQSHLNNDDADSHGDELLALWRELYGEESTGSIEWWSAYFLPSVPSLLGEPQFMVAPYVFLSTPPGWSSLADGAHYPGLDGLRGVIATDLFPHAAPVFQYRRPGDFRIRQGDPLMRLLPVPRYLLDAPYQRIELEKVN